MTREAKEKESPLPLLSSWRLLIHRHKEAAEGAESLLPQITPHQVASQEGLFKTVTTRMACPMTLSSGLIIRFCNPFNSKREARKHLFDYINAQVSRAEGLTSLRCRLASPPGHGQTWARAGDGVNAAVPTAMFPTRNKQNP